MNTDLLFSDNLSQLHLHLLFVFFRVQRWHISTVHAIKTVCCVTRGQTTCTRLEELDVGGGSRFPSTSVLEHHRNLREIKELDKQVQVNMCECLSIVDLGNYSLPWWLIDRQKGRLNPDETCAPYLCHSLSASQYARVSSSLRQDNSALTQRIRTSTQRQSVTTFVPHSN